MRKPRRDPALPEVQEVGLSERFQSRAGCKQLLAENVGREGEVTAREREHRVLIVGLPEKETERERRRRKRRKKRKEKEKKKGETEE